MDLVSAPSGKAQLAIVGMRIAAQSEIAVAQLVSNTLESSRRIAAASGGRGQMLDIHV
ncbi:MAG: hypothetical protein JWM77_4138 [Rhodospirillales bacterium]|jgi:hypothetical protein|nr:hypothetical protein [Rhodospirillales bacterium]